VVPDKSLTPPTLTARRRLSLLLLFALGFALRVAYFTWAPPDYAASISDYDQIAQNLLSGRGFSLPEKAQQLQPAPKAYNHSAKLVPTATRTPLYPLFLASIYTVFGRRLKVVYLAQTLIDMLSSILLYLLALRITSNRRAAFVSMLLYALYLPFMSQVAVLLNETIFGFLVLAFALAGLWAIERPSGVRFAIAAAILGVATLCRPTTFLFPAFFVVGVLVAKRRMITKLIRPSVAFVIAFVVVLMPWVIRNYLVLDYFGIVGTLGGEQVYAANYIWQKPGEPAPMVPPEMRKRLENLSPQQRNAILMREGIKEIIKHPLRFARNALYRTLTFWTAIGMGSPAFFYFSSGGAGRETCVFAAVVNIFLILSSIWAFARCPGPWRRRSLIPLLLLAYFYILHLPIIAFIRYSMPVIPFLMVFAAVWIVCVVLGEKVGFSRHDRARLR